MFIWQINVMLCYVMLCYVMLCYVMLCYIRDNESMDPVSKSDEDN